MREHRGDEEEQRDHPPCTPVTWALGKYYWRVFSVVPSCSKAAWLFWAGFLSSDSTRKMRLIPPLHSRQSSRRWRDPSPLVLCRTAWPTRSSLRLKLFPQSKMVWPGDTLGEVDDHVETLEFKTNVAMLSKNEVGDLGSYKCTGSRLLVSTYSVYTLWARSLYLHFLQSRPSNTSYLLEWLWRSYGMYKDLVTLKFKRKALPMIAIIVSRKEPNLKINRWDY